MKNGDPSHPTGSDRAAVLATRITNQRAIQVDVVPPISLCSKLLPGEISPHALTLSRDVTESVLFRGPGKDGILPSYTHIRPDALPNQLQSTVLDSSAFPRVQVYFAFDTHLFLFSRGLSLFAYNCTPCLPFSS
jgi:hypothetical protein